MEMFRVNRVQSGIAEYVCTVIQLKEPLKHGAPYPGAVVSDGV
jgi:hypothetical protein